MYFHGYTLHKKSVLYVLAF